jgi:hypothetical protein
MAINVGELAQINAGYTAITGKPVRHFVCPITLRDDANAELCDGHILNKGIRTARRTTIIQRKDVDGYFGKTIEPEYPFTGRWRQTYRGPNAGGGAGEARSPL